MEYLGYFYYFYVYRKLLPFMVFCLWNPFNIRNPVVGKEDSQLPSFKENILKN